MIALALVAGASLHTAHAGKKKVAQKKETVVLVTPSDSLSYAAGMSFTNGLIPFLKQQQGVDTAYMADFIRGFREAIQAGGNPQFKAYAAGIQIADQLKGRMLPDIQKEFTDSPDSVVASLFYQGFADALMQDTTLFKQTDADAVEENESQQVFLGLQTVQGGGTHKDQRYLGEFRRLNGQRTDKDPVFGAVQRGADG